MKHIWQSKKEFINWMAENGNVTKKSCREYLDLMLNTFYELLEERYTPEIAEDILAVGNSIKLNGYIHITPEYYKERKGMNVYEKTKMIIPARHRPKIKAGSKLIDACSKLDG